MNGARVSKSTLSKSSLSLIGVIISSFVYRFDFLNSSYFAKYLRISSARRSSSSVRLSSSMSSRPAIKSYYSLSHKHALEQCKETTDATGVLQDWRHTKIGSKSLLSVTIRHSAMAASQLEPESRAGSAGQEMRTREAFPQLSPPWCVSLVLIEQSPVPQRPPPSA